MSTFKIALAAGMLLCVPTIWVLAEDDHADPNDAALNTIGKTFKLEFKLVPEEDEPQLVVKCTVGAYGVGVDYSGPEEGFDLHVSGTLHPIGSKQRLLLSFDSQMGYVNEAEGEEATFTAKGGASIKIGQPKELTHFGEKTLVVVATVEDEK